jgi:hypothetical protein
MAKKPKSNAKLSLGVKIDQSNSQRKRRTLDPAQKKRAEKLRGIVERLKDGMHVQNRMLETWLTAEEFAAIEIAWQSELEYRDALGEKPQGVVEYEDLMKKADFQWVRSEGYADQGNNEQATIFLRLSESAYERALEHLNAQLDLHPELIAWFDRDVDFAVLGLDRDSVPRCVTSRSMQNQSRTSRNNQSKSDVKLAVVQKALDDLIFDAADTSTKSSKLHSLIGLPKDDWDF